VGCAVIVDNGKLVFLQRGELRAEKDVEIGYYASLPATLSFVRNSGGLLLVGT
jgi:hypothetical protein